MYMSFYFSVFELFMQVESLILSYMWDSHAYEIKFIILLICLMLIWLLDQLKEALKGREKFFLPNNGNQD